jgi:antirestriction protein ArdC
MEVEAETVALVVARRSGLQPRSEAYLGGYRDALDRFDLHAVLQAANAVERLRGLLLDLEASA